MIHPRVAIGVLSLSAAGFVAIVSQEDFTERAVVPTKNDRPTVGFGSTFREDGSPVLITDTIKPVPALRRSISHIAKDEAGLKRCVTGPLSQVEYDVLTDFAYQYGVSTACKSSMVLYANAARYRESCEAYTKYRFSGGYDCSTLINGKPNKRCWGVWTRNLARRDKCLEAQ